VLSDISRRYVGSKPVTNFDVCLTSAASKNIVIDKIEENFVFVVRGESHKCSRLVAEFLSPRVWLSHPVDPSIAEYIVQNPDSNDEFPYIYVPWFRFDDSGYSS
jgi:hypothetical protein